MRLVDCSSEHPVDLFALQETLTGFKWLANKAIDLMNEGKTVLFAFEEAIGKYLYRPLSII